MIFDTFRVGDSGFQSLKLTPDFRRVRDSSPVRRPEQRVWRGMLRRELESGGGDRCIVNFDQNAGQQLETAIIYEDCR